jgi:hypothetical protein
MNLFDRMRTRSRHSEQTGRKPARSVIAATELRDPMTAVVMRAIR